jgi:hypothetical protein
MSKLGGSLLQGMRAMLRSAGFDVIRFRADGRPVPPVSRLDSEQRERGDSALQEPGDPDAWILNQVAEFTMTSEARQRAMIDAVRYVTARGLQGSIVECGVWRGGSSMLAALALVHAGDLNRDLYLFDTFAGMTPPTEDDVAVDGISAVEHLINDVEKKNVWCIAGLEDVKRNMASTGYPSDRIHYVQGPVEQTVGEAVPPGPIALLRLDTDWYASTRHELEHLFPRLLPGAVLIIDDYGHWQGARKAVDEYFQHHGLHLLMHRLDYTGRMLIKA